MTNSHAEWKNMINDELSVQELALLNTLLKPSFPYKEVVIEKISTASIQVIREPHGISLCFLEQDEKSIGNMSGELIFMTAYQGDRNPLCANIVVYEGMLQEIYFYTADGSDLALDQIVLNDVDYCIRARFVDASIYASELYGIRYSTPSNEELQCIGLSAISDYETEVNQLWEVSQKCPELLGVSQRYVRNSFSIGIVFTLGSKGATTYNAVIMLSCIKNFFTLFVTDEDYSAEKRELNSLTRYPHGEVLNPIRDYFATHGFEELTISELQNDVLFWTYPSVLNSGVSLFECYFVGFQD